MNDVRGISMLSAKTGDGTILLHNSSQSREINNNVQRKSNKWSSLIWFRAYLLTRIIYAAVMTRFLLYETIKHVCGLRKAMTYDSTIYYSN